MRYQQVLERAGIDPVLISVVQEIYDTCKGEAKSQEVALVRHGSVHVNNTLGIAMDFFSAVGDRIAPLDKRVVLLALALHDCGKVYYEGKKAYNHAEVGAEMAQKFLLMNYSGSDKARVVGAIRNHERADNRDIVGAVVNFCDTLDITRDRLTERGRRESDNFSTQIERVEFAVAGDKLFVKHVSARGFGDVHYQNFLQHRFSGAGFGIARQNRETIKNVAGALGLFPMWEFAGRDMKLVEKSREL